jgi:penicillin-binding protein 1C
MRQISGVTGAGPLLHRAILDVARRYEPGTLPSPATAGAQRIAICQLSGQRAGATCPGTDEWFLPGTGPLGGCDWHGPDGSVAWPAEYAQWAAQSGLDARRTGGAAAPASVLAASDSGFSIVSPLQGDRYEIPPGTDPRYATIGLRAAGAPGDEPVRWWVDGRPERAARWRLRSGTHAIRAVAASGRSDEVTIQVR